MYKGIVKTAYWGWWTGWFCDCRLDPEKVKELEEKERKMIRKYHEGIPDDKSGV